MFLAQTKSTTELPGRSTEQAYLRRRPGAEVGKLILRSGGSTFLPWHPAAAAVAPWSASLAPKNAPGAGGSRRGKRETMRAPTNLCFAFEEAEPYVSRTGSRRLLDNFSPKGQV